jgi:hypothetical protein
MRRLSSLGSGCRCIAIAERNTWTPLSGAPEKVLPKSGFLLICTSSPNGRTSICFHRRLLIREGGPEITLVKRVTELRQVGLRACHCTEEFSLQQICPLGHRDKLAFKCPWFADTSCEPADGRIMIFFITDVELISDLITSLSYAALTFEEVFHLVSYMFDKSPVTNRPSSVPDPYYSENPPPVVGIFIFFDKTFLYY